MSSTLVERVPEPVAPPARRRGTRSLDRSAIILTTYLMIILDATIVITALPKIHQALGFSSTGLSWVQNAYTLTFGGFLLLGARAGDILGRRRVFVAGIALFTLASLMGGLAQSSGVAPGGPCRPGHRGRPSPPRRPWPCCRSASGRARAGPGHRRLQRGGRRGRKRRPRPRRHADQLGVVALGPVHQRAHRRGAGRPGPPLPA